MASIIKLQGSAVTLSSTPNNIAGATLVRVIHDHRGGGSTDAHLLQQKTASGDLIGSIWVPASGEITISKAKTDTLIDSDNSTDLLATPITITG